MCCGYRSGWVNVIFSKTKRRLHSKRWIRGFDDTKSIFIHVPKVAGTSMANALYGEDPWHYRIRDYAYLGHRRLEKYFKFAFVRNPYERLLSAYLYSFIQIERHPTTSVAFIARYDDFSDFVMNWITETNVTEHYFFYPQCDYLSDPHSDTFAVDFIGRLETIVEDFEFVKRRLGVNVQLEKANVSKSASLSDYYSKETAQRVAKVYAKDFEAFCYPLEIPDIDSG